MINLGLARFLGAEIYDLLKVPPFSAWIVTRSVERDLPDVEVYYEFEGHGVEVVCDETDRIRAIFLHRGSGEELVEIPFSLSRNEVLRRFGLPTNSGGASRIPGIGERGRWDRFSAPTVSVHVQYLLGRDEVEMITLMHPNAVPG